jgi:hypothetical protein
MSFLGSLFGARKMNADPDQQTFARLLIAAAEDGSKHGDLIRWLVKQPWSPSETRTRIIHALSIVKIASVPETYAKARQIGYDLNMATYQL